MYVSDEMIASIVKYRGDIHKRENIEKYVNVLDKECGCRTGLGVLCEIGLYENGEITKDNLYKRIREEFTERGLVITYSESELTYLETALGVFTDRHLGPERAGILDSVGARECGCNELTGHECIGKLYLDDSITRKEAFSNLYSILLLNNQSFNVG